MKASTAQVNPSLRMSLSGGMPSRAWMNSLYELAGTDMPVIAIDTAALIGAEMYHRHRDDFTNFFIRSELPEPLWIQHEADGKLNKKLTTSLGKHCDILMVLGGSTARLVQRWKQAEVYEPIIQSVEKGDVVACGVSAGAMVWFDGGYSDSEQYEPEMTDGWNYMYVNGTSTLPGLVSAHYSDTDVHGLRSDGFKSFLNDHAGEWDTAVGIDTYAAILVKNGIAKVIDVNPVGGNNKAMIHIFHTTAHNETIYKPEESIPLISK